ncbi:orotidine-5'-phosphate decarboxylase [Jonesia quinghaiensis]|uniref:orotidine-5'-phosphate decarboxylase n=1 Tax=Jonesia quinghaiensis TaxID=262806 RepID=UPI000426A285|nr:orotidine-5'-phosphate decarboxylase [Jonesia quinghaiensis]
MSGTTAPVTRSQAAPFGERLRAAMTSFGPLCVGLDPHPGLLQAWGLPDTATGVRQFCDIVLDAVGGRVAAIKPQAALFERHGSAGFAALEHVIERAYRVDTLCIVDAKRGDIGSTMAGYADAFLAEGSSLAGDAVTLSPYLGFGSLRPALEKAAENRRGVFVLCLTSNPEGSAVQHAVSTSGVSVAAQIARDAAAVNAEALGGDSSPQSLGPVGLVIGATIGDAIALTGTDLSAVHGAFLAPGVGAQGAGGPELHTVFGDVRNNVLASSSRGVLAAGPDVIALRHAAETAAQEVTHALA